MRDIFSCVVKTGLTSFFGSDRTRPQIFVRFREVDVFGKSLKRVVFLVLFLCLSSLPNILATTTRQFQGTQRG